MVVSRLVSLPVTRTTRSQTSETHRGTTPLGGPPAQPTRSLPGDDGPTRPVLLGRRGRLFFRRLAGDGRVDACAPIVPPPPAILGTDFGRVPGADQPQETGSSISRPARAAAGPCWWPAPRPG